MRKSFNISPTYDMYMACVISQFSQETIKIKSQQRLNPVPEAASTSLLVRIRSERGPTDLISRRRQLGVPLGKLCGCGAQLVTRLLQLCAQPGHLLPPCSSVLHRPHQLPTQGERRWLAGSAARRGPKTNEAAEWRDGLAQNPGNTAK